MNTEMMQEGLFGRLEVIRELLMFGSLRSSCCHTPSNEV